MSAVDILYKDYKGGDKNAHKRFKKILHENLDANSDQNGEGILNYVRELRNSIVHRGCNIFSMATLTNTGIPILIIPKEIPDQRYRNLYYTDEVILLKLIKKLDLATCSAILEHLNNEKLYETNITVKQQIDKTNSLIKQNSFMPEWVKREAIKSIKPEYFQSAKRSKVKNLKSLLKSSELNTMIDKILEEI